MSSLLLPRRFYSQPQGAVQLQSWANAGVVIVENRDLVNSSYPYSMAGSVITDYGVIGRERKHISSGGSDIYATPASLNNVTQYTVFGLTRINLASSGANFGIAAKTRNIGNLNGFGTYRVSTQMYVEHSSGEIGTGTEFLNAITDNTYRFWHITWDGFRVRVYVGGVPFGDFAYSSPMTTGNGLFNTLSSRDISTTVGSVALTGMLPICLSAECIKIWGANPWQIFKVSE